MNQTMLMRATALVLRSEAGHVPGSVRRTKDTEDDDAAALPTHSLDVSYQAAAGTSPGSIYQSEGIPIHRYLILKTVQSIVVYCLTFLRFITET